MTDHDKACSGDCICSDHDCRCSLRCVSCVQTSKYRHWCNPVQLCWFACFFSSVPSQLGIFIIGGLSVDLLKPNIGRWPGKYLTHMDSFGFIPLTLRPTLVTHHSATLINQLWSDDTKYVITPRVVVSYTCDHFPVFGNSEMQLRIDVSDNYCTDRRKTI